jgi:hypothetical protein
VLHVLLSVGSWHDCPPTIVRQLPDAVTIWQLGPNTVWHEVLVVGSVQLAPITVWHPLPVVGS